jgi:hypothetical protein
MNGAPKLLAKWIKEETAVEFWCEQVDGLFSGKEVGQCVVRRVSDTEIALHKPNGKTVNFRSPEGFVVERCLASYVEGAFQVHIRMPSCFIAWVNLKPLSN